MKIEFDIATPSLNDLHQNKWQIINWKKKFLSRMKNYEILALRKKQKRYLTIQRHGSRILDDDNFYGGCKPLIDAIKEKGLIIDDRNEWCEIKFLPQVKCKRGCEKVFVWIEEKKL